MLTETTAPHTSFIRILNENLLAPFCPTVGLGDDQDVKCYLSLENEQFPCSSSRRADSGQEQNSSVELVGIHTFHHELLNSDPPGKEQPF